jgi:hypothetical protein
MSQPPQVAREPSPWRPLLRLFMEAVEIAFVVGLHAFFRWWAHVTHQEQEWLARFLTSTAALFAAISFLVIGGAEVAADCWAAVRSAWRRIRED